MNEKEMFALLLGLWNDFGEPAFLRQVLALAISVLLAWVLSREWQRRQAREQAGADYGALRALGEGSLKRVAFPLLALLIVLVVRKAFRYWHIGPVSLFDLAVPLLLSMALVRAAIYVLRHAFSPSSWLASSERIIATTIWLCLALHLIGLSGPLIELLEQVSLSVGRQQIDLWTLLTGLVTVVVTVLVALWLSRLIDQQLLDSEKIDANVRVVLERLLRAVLTVVALLLSLSMVGIDITALSVFSGALAVGLGLGLQRIASNYVSGFIILLDRSIRLGNVVAVDATTSGVVTQITARYTVVKTLTGTEVIIPNEYLVSNIIRNESLTDPRSRVVVPVQVAYGTDLDLAMRLMVEAAKAQPRVLADPAPQALLTAFADSGINLDLGFWIGDPHEGTGGVRSAINLAIWRSFADQGIEIPFPQREVRLVREGDEAAGRARV
ncbi:mechanosensitive ion channel family protein [Accumulibacter sp.]|uniref:mechanosensitive ion channel family protein n=1 Tax=Accumulibacter sp. TaxID=2053492 RepID=UPI0025D3F5A6|nr:mechanosensitive ion channel domain-containing protein [Accumulibacter sp.]MCM8596450.1 mechanosensitive ion channel [Accumulibacter sp.]MCM8627074.1 mechanosensitive ion channel [Accumulibacter sp.]MDS4050599.1 mechanosensitive ion channel [Accumulibacter sp.]